MTDIGKAAYDLTVLHQILALYNGQLDDFHPKPPPTPIKQFLSKADLYELQGLLVATLATMRRKKP